LSSKLNLYCFASRTWAESIYHKLSTLDLGEQVVLRAICFERAFYNDRDCEYRFDDSIKQLIVESESIESVVPHLDILSSEPCLFLFYGWSWKIDVARFPGSCLVLHPSILPAYRGGSPIQNQVIDGQTESGITIFIATNEIDKGPVLFCHEMSLQGYLDEIIARIIFLGVQGTLKILSGYAQLEEVKSRNDINWEGSNVYKRRKPSQSILRVNEDLNRYNADSFYNLVRCLQPPYPTVKLMFEDESLIEVLVVNKL
jgi:methionyl-tRNA formyltransferase